MPLSNFITRKPVQKLAQIDRVDQTRYFDIKAAVAPGLTRPADADGTGDVPINANERIAHLTEWLDSGVLPAGISYEWTGDQEDQAESGAFLQKAFAGALGLMFIILLAQFNSVYNAVLVLLAVVLSTTGVLIGMLVMNQPFSIIMTGTGIVALAGIVVNNNIVLIDTYQEFSRYMPRIEAITRTAEARIRPVLLTTITTMAGLAPMVIGLSLDFGQWRLLVQFANRPVVETAGHRCGVRAWHRDDADAGLHTLDAGASDLGQHLCRLGCAGAGGDVDGPRQPRGARLGASFRRAPGAGS